MGVAKTPREFSKRDERREGNNGMCSMQATSRAPKKAIVDREIDSRHDVFSGFCCLSLVEGSVVRFLAIWGWSYWVSSWVNSGCACVVCGLCLTSLGGEAVFRWSWECRERCSRPQDHRHGCTSPRTSRRRFSPPSPSPSAWYHYA